MKLEILNQKTLNASIRALEDAKLKRQGGLLVAEQIALDNLIKERCAR